MTQVRRPTGAILAALTVILAAAGCGGPAMSFDQAAWNQGRGIYDRASPRLALADDARASGVAVGARRDTIRRLLGEPDSQAANGDRWFLGKDDLGPEVRVLAVDYDASGAAIRVDVVRE